MLTLIGTISVIHLPKNMKILGGKKLNFLIFCDIVTICIHYVEAILVFRDDVTGDIVEGRILDSDTKSITKTVWAYIVIDEVVVVGIT